MTKVFSKWHRDHAYRTTARQLQALSAADLDALGIPRSEINHLALEVSLAERSQSQRLIVALAVFCADWIVGRSVMASAIVFGALVGQSALAAGPARHGSYYEDQVANFSCSAASCRANFSQ